jgi:signal transduction histidine kinase
VITTLMPTTDNPRYTELLSLAVHEFRTPASVVGGYLRMLQRDSESPLTDRQRKMIDEAEKSCARMVALIGEMSEVSKLDSGAVALDREQFDLFSLVDDVANGVHESGERDVRLELRGEHSGASVLGDRTRLKHAFDAVFRAILREQPSACTVVVDRRLERLERNDGRANRALVVVAPDARVQAAYEADRGVFDEKRGGMGLALPLARRVIERHGGRIWAPEDAEERGAAVVSIPLSE